MTSDDQTGSTREGLQEMSESNLSTVFPGDLLGGRSPAERLEFLAGPMPAEPSAAAAAPAAHRPLVYRDYTRRLRDT